MIKLTDTVIIASVTTSTVVLTQTVLKRASIERRMMNDTDGTVELYTDVSLILPTLNEEDLIRRSLDSLMNQNIIIKNPERFELIVVDSGSEDTTVEIAREYTDKVIIAPKGKLTARVIGIEESLGGIIVSLDADTVYPPNWLNSMLKNMANTDKVVGVSCPKFFYPKSVNKIKDTAYAVMQINRRILPSMSGGNSIFTKDAYYKIDGFNTDIDQTNVRSMVGEEEEMFWTRLKRVGRVIFDTKSAVYTSPRQLYRKSCEIDIETIDNLWCRDIAMKQRF